MLDNARRVAKVPGCICSLSGDEKCSFSYPRSRCPKSMRDNRDYRGPYQGHHVPDSEKWDATKPLVRCETCGQEVYFEILAGDKRVPRNPDGTWHKD